MKVKVNNLSGEYLEKVRTISELENADRVTLTKHFDQIGSLLNAVIGYCNRRVTVSQEKIEKMKTEVTAKIDRLYQIKYNKIVEQATFDSIQLESSAKFLSEVDEQIDVLTANPSVTANLGLPYASSQYRSAKDFLKTYGGCESSHPPYMETGCLRYKSYSKVANNLIDKSIPRTIKFSLQLLREEEVGNLFLSSIEKIDNLVKANEIEKAVIDYDSLLNLIDGVER